jgi:hypothetical protein
LAAPAAFAQSAAPEWDLPRALPLKSAVVVDKQVLLRKLSRLDELAGESAGASKQPQELQRRALLRDLLAQVRGELEVAPELRSLRQSAGAAPAAALPASRPAPEPPKAPAPAAPLPQQVQPMAEDQFNALAEEVSQAAFADDRLVMLRDAAPTHAFTVAQVARLLTSFPYPADRMRAARLLWPRVVDRANGASLYDSFSFQSEKDELKTLLGE